MSYFTATENYLNWLQNIIPIDGQELKIKNRKMAVSPFHCLRGTFYRWAHLWQKLDVPKDVPTVLGVGDLHIENFGTWRDSEGRLAWGVNDFDEACYLPYLADLLRLAVSAHLAFTDPSVMTNARKDQTPLNISEICDTICNGYLQGLEKPHGFILGENHYWMLEIAQKRIVPPLTDDHNKSAYEAFVKKMNDLPRPLEAIPEKAIQILTASLPPGAAVTLIGDRIAGIGSLGRQRYTAVVDDWCGGMVVREVKRLAPSAWLWANGEQASRGILYSQISSAALRSTDPTLRIIDDWVVRRLAADADKIDLNPRAPTLNRKLLEAMGHETANSHWPTVSNTDALGQHLRQHGREWLPGAVKIMTDFTKHDHQMIVKGEMKT